MSERDLAHARPWLLASLFFGLTYVFVERTGALGAFAILWKGASAGLLIPYLMRWRAVAARPLLGLMFGCYALADMLLEIDLVWGAFLFLCGHVAAIGYFWRNRRAAPEPSQRLLAITIPAAALVIGFFLSPGSAQEPGLLIYVAFVSAMAGSAWYSRFPRYRTGVGALLFLLSDLILFAREGGLLADSIAGWLVWPIYYAGVFMMATGIVQRSRAAPIDDQTQKAL